MACDRGSVRFFVTVSCFFSCAISGLGTVPAIAGHFAAAYGTAGEDHAGGAVSAADGGVFVTGTGTAGAFLIRVDSSGDILWQKRFGGLEYGCRSIANTAGGGIALLLEGVRADQLLIKLDGEGVIEWQRHGLAGPENVFLRRSAWYHVVSTSDFGYALIGHFRDDLLGGIVYCQVMKVDSSGNTEWRKTYGDGIGDGQECDQLSPTQDGGYLLGGLIGYGSGGGPPWIVRLDSFGNILWQKTYVGLKTEFLTARETKDGGIIGAGTAWMLKLDSLGDVVWAKEYRAPGPAYETAPEFFDVRETATGGFFVVGDIYGDYSHFYRIVLLELDATGAILWQRGYASGGDAYPEPLMAISDDSIVLSATTLHDVWLLKVDLEGQIGSTCPIEFTPTITAHDWVFTATETGAVALDAPLEPGGTSIEASTADLAMVRQDCYAGDEDADEDGDESLDERNDCILGNPNDEGGDEQPDFRSVAPPTAPEVPRPERPRNSRFGDR